MNHASTAQKAPRDYQKHGDSNRVRRVKEGGLGAIDARTAPGRNAMAWWAWALAKKGGKACSRGTREMINEATFLLWRMLCLRDYIALDARKRGAVINRRTGRLPKVHEQYDSLSARFDQKVEALELDKAKGANPLSNLIGGGLG